MGRDELEKVEGVCDGETRDCDAACYRCGLGLNYSPPAGQNTASAGAHGDHLIQYILDCVEPRADGGGDCAKWRNGLQRRMRPPSKIGGGFLGPVGPIPDHAQ